MDITPFLEMKIAPRAVFERLAEFQSRPRFMVPKGPGAWEAVTWGAFADEIREIGLFLHDVVSHEDRVAVYGNNRVEWASAALAIQAAGGVIVPVYPASTAQQAGYVLAHADVKVVFVDTKELLGRLFEVWNGLPALERVVVMGADIDAAQVLEARRASGKSVPTLADADRKLYTWARARGLGAARHKEEPGAFERRMLDVKMDQPGLMLYTSGTSGNPKGVPLTHKNVSANGQDWLRCNAPLLEDNSVDLLWLPMSHIFGLGEMCLGNTLGWLTYLSDPATCLGKLPEVRPNVFMSVPSHWEKLAHAAMHKDTHEARALALAEATGGRLKYCLSGGAGLKREVKELFWESGILLVEGYGLTETSPTLTLNRHDAFRFDSVGKPLPQVEIKLAEDGEILARGPNVFGGYHKNPEATREAFTDDGWFKTGDVGRFTDDGFLQIIDRKKDILVTAGGKNVPPANIEIRFKDDPFIAHVVVYGEGKKFLVAGVWLNEDVVQKHLESVAEGARGEARRALVQKRVDAVNAELASYESIKKFAVMDTPLTVEGELLTASFKVRRKKVYETFRDAFEALYTEAR
jgi:long-chain acyl-CoA synthetase